MASSECDDLVFPFIRIAPRAAKLRKAGMTIVADRGTGLNRVADLLDASGDHIDFFKIAIGAYRLQRADFICRKIAALKAGTRRRNGVISTPLYTSSAGIRAHLFCMRKSWGPHRKLSR